jgi:L,D-transpeptidase ErfK/SrfK
MNKLSLKGNILTALVLSTLSYNANAASFNLPPEQNGLVGNPAKKKIIKAGKTETLLDIARTYDLGQNQIVWANKNVDRWLPSKPVQKTISDKDNNKIQTLGKGKNIHIPNSYLLPNIAREGIVLNLPEYRLYYYYQGKVITHPISIGRVDWNTPLGRTSIIEMKRNPTWTPPASIRKEHAAMGDILPAVFPAGPDNPLGLFAMRLGRAGYLIHSTNKPLGVGMRVSHGCIRMYPEDIKRIFPSVKKGTVVQILNNPIKVGWGHNGLYISVHPDLEDNSRNENERLNDALRLIDEVKGGEIIQISGGLLKKALKESNGIPVAIYTGARMLLPDPLINPSPFNQTEPKRQMLPSLRAQQQAAGLLPPPPQKQGLITALTPKKAAPKKISTPVKKPAQKAVVPSIKKPPTSTIVQKKKGVVSSVKKNIPAKVVKVVPKKKIVSPPPKKPTLKRTVVSAPKKQVKKPVLIPASRLNKKNGYNVGETPSLKTTKPQKMTADSLPPKPPRLADPVKKVVKKPAPVKRVKSPAKPPLPRLNNKPTPEFSILKGAR